MADNIQSESPALVEIPPSEPQDDNLTIFSILTVISSYLIATLKSILNPFSRFPIIKWLPNYKISYIQRDLIAGFTVGLTLLPQCLAYSQQAGLPPYYGLYTSFTSPLIYALMGGAKDITNGPTAIMSSLISTFAKPPENASLWLNEQYEYGSSPTRAILLAFFVGILLLTVAIFQLGWLASFISHTMATGFIQASAITIPIGQIKKITGQPGIRKETFEAIYDIFTKLDLINWTDFIMGVVSLVVLYLLKILKDYCNDWNQPTQFDHQNLNSTEGRMRTDTCPYLDEPIQTTGEQTRATKYLKIFGWFIGSIRNAIVVAVSAIIGYLFHLYDNAPTEETHFRNLTITGDIPPGLPAIELPSFSETYLNFDGHVETETFSVIFPAIATGIIICAVMGYLESYAIARSFARSEKYNIDGEQEMYAIGASCFMTSFTQGFPVTGSFSRSSINNQCDVATPLAGVVTSAMILLSLQFLTELFKWIPTSALGAVIILAASNMFKWDVFKHGLMKGPYLDRILFVITFCVCLYETAIGIVVGCALSALFVIISSAFPEIDLQEEQQSGPLTLTIKESSIKYPSVGKLTKILNQYPGREIKIDCQHVMVIDNSAALAVIDLVREHANSRLSNVRTGVRKVLMANGLEAERFCGND